MTIKSRLLGMAFAASDVLFELDGDRVTLALGAGPVPGVDPGAAWSGQKLETFLAASCLAQVKAAVVTLAPGVRSSPIEVEVLTGDGRARKASLRAFLLPDLAPFVSCALAWQGVAYQAAPPKTEPLLDARGLLKRLGSLLAVGGTGPELSVDFFEIPGLDALDDDLHRRASERIEARLQSASVGGVSAARLAPDRFALMRDSADVTDLAAEIRALGAAEGLNLSPVSSRAEVGHAEAAVAVRTLRLALEECLKDGAAAGERFGERLRRTVENADRFRGIVRAREFTLAWQPIVSLDTRLVHHFEALSRFGGAQQAPTGPIAMAEELGLIEDFDLAVAEKAVSQLRKPGFGLVKAAINVSGVSLSNDHYIEGLLRMTAGSPEIRKRLMVEITETAAVSDLDGANRRLQALREADIKVCLDDYGVGAASLTYLRKLSVDLLKMDGVFAREIETDPKMKTLATHLLDLCRELKIQTVAEMVETEAQADIMKGLGVNYGQGWLFGRPTETPVLAAPVSSRRKGEVVGWG
ncbi:EAL domain-containing protein [Brevundimonas sp. GCM10030266]|uniref:EAL domain-containing protein n=1 Tax=Brevundimonas sp. GCM10030266 TaxID=3273386 RepID=UPI00361236E1